MFNLLTIPWLPVRRASGPDIIVPSQLTDAIDTDPVLGLDWPRADFQVAGLELLVGLLATCCPPRTGESWLDGWHAPPDPDRLKAAFAPYTHAFKLDGKGPRVLQAFEPLLSEPEPVERLLIDAAGGSTVKQNTDLLVRRNHVAALGRAAAAMALFTFQAWAPAGGAGNRTGLRGGGPMTTLILPGARGTLWHMIWANVPLGRAPEEEAWPLVFPWLAPTVGSATGRTVTPGDAHELQAWWGMPRRIRLVFEPCDPPCRCDLTGRLDTVRVTGWQQRPHGANYDKWGDLHPLTPRYRLKPNTEILPLHPQPGGVGYRHWLGLVVAERDGLRIPAPNVETWRNRTLDTSNSETNHGQEDRILAAGFDMDNMKARGFVESEMPLPAIPDAATRRHVDDMARALVKSADATANLLRRAVRDALFGPGATVKLDWVLLSSVREQLWSRTEMAFHAALTRGAQRTDAGSEQAEWLQRLRDTAMDVFDEAAPLGADGSTLPKSDEGIARLLRARRHLFGNLNGRGKDGAALFETLGLPPVEAKPARKVRAR